MFVLVHAVSAVLDTEAPIDRRTINGKENVAFSDNVNVVQPTFIVVFRNPLGRPLPLAIVADRHLQAEPLLGLLNGYAGLAGGRSGHRAISGLVRHLGEYWPEQEQPLVHHRWNQIVALDVEVHLLPRRPLPKVEAAVVVEMRLDPGRSSDYMENRVVALVLLVEAG